MTTPDRVPPGQTATAKWPVLTYGDVPQIDPARWRFRIWGAVESPRQWTWAELSALPVVESQSDIPCVPRWSRLDTHWRGVRPRDLLAAARPRPEARHIMVHAEPDYTTNLPLEALLDDDVLLAHMVLGKPLTAEHGGPVRLVVPKRYGWKSAKWLTGIELHAEDQPGFWEVRGYHNEADPWREERFR